ncbi:MAG: SUMF1/EgtB/PvdO family nonheme iron enzyme [Prevotellaceae bacterium]|nr:SUMF1/EgtB/PvdO family nonheme iron enzyme [Candidatus Minthosoma caballi]
MKRVLSTLIFLLCLISAGAQELKIKSFALDANDITASSQLRNDGNGDPCALIKVQLAAPGATFDGNLVGDVAYKVNQYWVYMTSGSKHLQVNHPNYLPLDVTFSDYEINSVKGKCTYVLVINAAETVSAKQKLTVKYSPRDAMLLIDGQPVGDNGVAELDDLTVGNHSFNVAKKGYIGQQGTITLSAIAPGKLLVELDKESEVASNSVKTVQSTNKQQPKTQKKEEKGDDSMEDLVKNSISAQLTLANERLLREHQDSQQTKQQQKTAEQQTASASSVAETQAEAFSNEPKTFTVNGVSFTMIPVEGGTFSMGAVGEGNAKYLKSVKPHSVSLDSYMIGETEVTQALWEAVMNKTVSQIAEEIGEKVNGVGPDHPMYYISWDDCQEFVTKLNTLTGQHFRLPTEAEWEYACRGGKQSKGYRYSGSNNIDEVARYFDHSWSSDVSSSVKTKLPNELGIYDMSGNVCEWCSDWWDYDYYKKSPNVNPKGASKGPNKVIRGGGVRTFFQAEFRTYERKHSAPESRSNNIGLRLAL